VTKSLQAVAAFLILAFLGEAEVGATDAPTAKPIAQCETRAPESGDKRDVKCIIAASAADQHLLFRVMFLGSHDDTILSMTASLNGQPLTCDPGSKMSSRFEDGEISLECIFPVKAGAGAKQVLEMSIVWTHAQYAEYEITSR
jgi:hypothetical protein